MTNMTCRKISKTEKDIFLEIERVNLLKKYETRNLILVIFNSLTSDCFLEDKKNFNSDLENRIIEIIEENNYFAS